MTRRKLRKADPVYLYQEPHHWINTVVVVLTVLIVFAYIAFTIYLLAT